MLKIKGQKKDPIVPPLSISALFDLSSFAHNKCVVINHNELDFTRKEVKRDRKILAKAFLELGVKSGDIITIINNRSCYENVLIFLAANKIGAIVSFLDEKTPRQTILKYIEEFNSKLVITYKKPAKYQKELKKDAKTIKNIINLDGNVTLDSFWLGKTEIKKIAEKHRGRVPKNFFSGKKDAVILFTSGSTSGPKPMVFKNQALIAAALYSKAASGIKMWDKNIKTWFSFVTFEYPYGFWTSVMTPIIGGASVILTPDLNPENYEYYLSKKIDVLQSVPLFFATLPKILPEDFDLSNVKMCISGGERLEKEASAEMVEYFKAHGADIKVCNGYGVGECLGSISVAVGSTYRPDTVGRIVPGVHAMILDPATGEELNFGKVGVLHVTGKHLLKEYYNRPDANEDKFVTIKRKRFIDTGDLAMVSETGFISLVGRARFFINNVPAKVYYEYVRAAVMKSDLIKTAYVVKGLDEKLALAAYAFVIPKDDVPRNNETRKAIIKTASEPFYMGKRRIELKDYEVPRKVIFLDEFPATKADKINFRQLEKMARELGEIK